MNLKELKEMSSVFGTCRKVVRKEISTDQWSTYFFTDVLTNIGLLIVAS